MDLAVQTVSDANPRRRRPTALSCGGAAALAAAQLALYLTATMSTVRISGSEASSSGATPASAFGISPLRWARRPASSSNVSKMP
jgi:hypothetical protein